MTHVWGFDERADRRERNAIREAARKRAEHLEILSDEDRRAFLAAEQRERDEQAAQEAREYEEYQREQEQRWRDDVERHASEALAMVVSTWEELRGHRITGERRREFSERDEVPQLAKFEKDLLVRAARWAMEEHDGELLLTHWLAEAQELDAKAKARAAQPEWKRIRPAGGPV